LPGFNGGLANGLTSVIAFMTVEAQGYFDIMNIMLLKRRLTLLL